MRNKRLIAIFSILLAVTLIVLLSSIIFAVKTVNTRCRNHAFVDEQLDQDILDNLGIEKGKSIFLVKQQKVIDNVEKKVPDVRVINIERKFPNRITVHYVKLFDYFEVAMGGSYYSLTHEGRVVDNHSEARAENDKIVIKTKSVKNMERGDYLYDDSRAELLSRIVTCLEILDLENEKATSRFSFIDIETERDMLYIGIEDSPVIIKIDNASDHSTLLDKIDLGYSVFVSDSSLSQRDKNGDYPMIYVISPTTAMNPPCDYQG